MAFVSVTCSDGVVVEVDCMIASKMSLAFRKKIDESGHANIALDNVNSRSLIKVLEYCSIHCEPGTTDLKAWDNKFVKVEPSILCELASAAYHLEIKSMVDLTCYAIAQLLKGNTPEEIRRIFNIIYDFGPDDDVPPPTIRDKLRNKWIRRSTKRSSSDNNTQTPTMCSTNQLSLPPPSHPPPYTSLTHASDASVSPTVDELLLYINNTPEQDHCSKAVSKGTKKTKRKKKPRDAKTSHPSVGAISTPDILDSGELHNYKAGRLVVPDTVCLEEETHLDELDREVEEFRLRLEAAKHIPPGYTRQKISFAPQIWSNT